MWFYYIPMCLAVFLHLPSLATPVFSWTDKHMLLKGAHSINTTVKSVVGLNLPPSSRTTVRSPTKCVCWETSERGGRRGRWNESLELSKAFPSFFPSFLMVVCVSNWLVGASFLSPFSLSLSHRVYVVHSERERRKEGRKGWLWLSCSQKEPFLPLCSLRRGLLRR